MLLNLTLRPTQIQAVEDCRTAYMQGHKSLILVGPTGWGKTVIFSYIAYHAAQKGNKILIIVHRKELLRQASESLKTVGLNHGWIVAGYSMGVAPVQIAMVNTLARRLDKIKFVPNLIIADEFHHSVSETYRKVFDRFRGVPIFGCTATPQRLDGKGLGTVSGGFADKIVLGPTRHELIDSKWLPPSVIYAPDAGIDLKGIRRIGGDFAKDDLDGRINKKKIVGCVIDHYNRICPGKRAMAFCVTVKHAERVAEEFNLAGIPAASIDGKMSDVMRQSRLNGLRDLNYQVLTSCDLIMEGIDIPAVSVAIWLRPTESLNIWIQGCGRCGRLFPGKKETIIIDHVGNVHRHGSPDATHEWSLEGTKKKKKKTDENIKRFRTCPRCYRVYHIHVDICPQCGTKYTLSREEIKQIKGELQRFEEIRQKKVAQQKSKSEIWQAKTLEALTRVGKERGYKHAQGWAERIIAAREAKAKTRRLSWRPAGMAEKYQIV